VDPPLELAVLDYGSFEVNEGNRLVPITGYLIRSGSRVVLVDTGFPARYVADSVGSARADGLDDFGRVVSITPENLPPAQLALAGLEPGDVTDLVITHGDIDHIGDLAGFPAATLVVGRRELEHGPPRYFGAARPEQWPTDQRCRPIDGDEELLPGVELLSTPGHAPGHLSLLVRLARTGPVLLAGDAISRPAELESGNNGGAWDQQLARASAARLLDVARREGATVIYGHDWEQWTGLAKAPYFYT
jgi:N-acyl homoserine lactone hydrolase